MIELGLVLLGREGKVVEFDTCRELFLSELQLPREFPSSDNYNQPIGDSYEGVQEEWLSRLQASEEIKLRAACSQLGPCYTLVVVFGVPLPGRHFRETLRTQRAQLFQNLFCILDGGQGIARVLGSWDSGERKTLRDLYLSLPAPDAACFTEIRTKSLAKVSSELKVGNGHKDLQTKLFPYQRSTVQCLLLKEQQPTLIPDPSYFNLGSYWICLENWSWHKDADYWTNCRGGVLCEDMGTGKTCMCIALICATKNWYAPLPFGNNIELSSCAPLRDGVQTLQHFSLLSLAQGQIPWRDHTIALPKHIRRMIKLSRPYFLRQGTSSPRDSFARAKLDCKVYLASCTLVVVPDNLLDQWSFEVAKHCKPGSLKVEVVASADQPMPPVAVILKRHMLLINQSSISRELSAIREGTSSLAQVFFQRLIVDEGHSYCSQFASHTLATSAVMAGYRWVCSGTPTRYVLAAKADRASLVDDLRRLQKLCGNFLKCDLLVHAAKKFLKYAIRPFLESIASQDSKKGKLHPTYHGLQRFLEHILVRNNATTISAQVSLPPLYENVEYLPLFQPQADIYNALIAFFRVNAVTSEREGTDYLFHPTNREHLTLLINNLTDVLLWHSGFIPMQNLLELLNNTNSALRSGKYTGADYKSLEQSLAAIKKVLSAPESTRLAIEDESNGELLFRSNQDVKNLGSPAAEQHSWITTGDVLRSMDDSRLSSVMLLGTMSTKFNFLVKRLVEHACSGEKVIVYCQTAPEMYYVSLLCCVANITHLIYTKSNHAAHAIVSGRTSTREKAARLVTFNTSNLVKVFVMEAQAAAYGIDLSSASRIYFVSPMAHDAMYRQAVKRVHRIGCTKPVYVCTLCVKGSFEEELLCKAPRFSHDEDIASIANVSVMVESAKQRIVQNAEFLDWTNAHDPSLESYRTFGQRVLSLYNRSLNSQAIQSQALNAEEELVVDDEDENINVSPRKRDLALESLKLTRAFLQRLSESHESTPKDDEEDEALTKKRRKRKERSLNTDLHRELGLAHVGVNKRSPQSNSSQDLSTLAGLSGWQSLDSQLSSLFDVSSHLRNTSDRLPDTKALRIDIETL